MQRKKWTDQIIIICLKSIINDIGYFPSTSKLIEMYKKDLVSAIHKHGGLNKFRKLLGYDISLYEKYVSDQRSYISRRGKKSENIVKDIIIEYCNIHNLQSPCRNVKLSKYSVIEFVCNTGKTIGIDVTNTGEKETITRKWCKKDYHKHLDELWIVVFSDSFTSSDYDKWNNQSPDNVKIFSIYQFLEELDYSLDEYTKNKIDKYCSCTFHTKEELKNKIFIDKK